MEGHVAAVQQLIQRNCADLNIPDKVGGAMFMTVVVVWGLPGRDAVLGIGWEDGAHLGDGTEAPRSGAAVGQSGGRPRPAGSGKLAQPNRKVWYTCRLSCSLHRVHAADRLDGAYVGSASGYRSLCDRAVAGRCLSRHRQQRKRTIA
jgi:hypothetical protein